MKVKYNGDFIPKGIYEVDREDDGYILITPKDYGSKIGKNRYWVAKNSCEIIKENEMRKEDLKAGYLVERRNGTLAHVVQAKSGLITLGENGIYTLYEDFNDDMTTNHSDEYDVMKVYGFCSLETFSLGYSTKHRELLWQRDSKKTITLELTDDQIEDLKKQGFNVK